MTVHFVNEEPIDLLALSTMGVSVKKTDNPIGMFGTGLKYAIAVLLRTGHNIRLVVDGEPVYITSEPTTIRGEEFQLVHLDGRPLGFTTELGKRWEVWQAYRELRSNAIDEQGGQVMTSLSGKWGTVVTVSGPEIDEVHRKGGVFLESTPMLSLPHIGEIHEGRSEYMYYRGVRAGKLEAPSLLTYNITNGSVDLTEDRTIEYPWEYNNFVGNLLPRIPSRHLAREVILAREGTLEYGLEWRGSMFSDEVREVLGELSGNARSNHSAVQMWMRVTEKMPDYREVSLSAYEEEIVLDALRFCHRVGCSISRKDFSIVEGLGEGILGIHSKVTNSIMLSHSCLDMGARRVASTLYEEWLHLRENLQDKSLTMQNHLLDKVFALADELHHMEEPGNPFPHPGSGDD